MPSLVRPYLSQAMLGKAIGELLIKLLCMWHFWSEVTVVLPAMRELGIRDNEYTQPGSWSFAQWLK